jgi:Uncharacterized protein conserved in bacteria
MIIMSGILSNFESLKAFDFGSLVGKFGTIGELKQIFRGSGGFGARDGMLFAFTLLPGIIVAIAMVRIVDGFGGLFAAEKLIRPLFKPLVGIPGICGLAFITSLQSSDGGAAMTKELFEAGYISEDERTIFTTMQLSADGIIVNYFATVVALFAILQEVGISPILPFMLAIVMKFAGANIMRYILFINSRKAAEAGK